MLLGLAALTRLQGVLLVLPLWLLLLRRDGWRLRASQLWLLLGIAGALAFFGYVAVLTGVPRAYLDAQIAWGRTGAGNVAPGQNLGSNLSPVLGTLLVVLCAAVFLLVYLRPGPDPAGVRAGADPVHRGAAGERPAGSVGRYAMLAFPYVWLLAGRRSPVFRATWPALSAGLLGVLALLEFGGYFVALSRGWSRGGRSPDRATAITRRWSSGMRNRSQATCIASRGRICIREPRLSDHCTGTTTIR